MAEKIVDLSLKKLRLDPKNPRLPTSIARTQSAMLRHIALTSSISELMTAIGQHGYFAGEPLIVVPAPGEDFYIVVEGNRRLTALQLLQNPKLVPKNSSILRAAEEAKNKPSTVPCVIFKERKEVINYLGYRHITGVKQWEPLAKARYVAEYFDTATTKGRSAAERYREVARSIGSHAGFIKRTLDGFAVYRLLEDEDFFEIDDLDEQNISFSLLTTAVGYEAILGFVSTSTDPYLHPNKLKTKTVKELARWLFQKNNDGETPLGDSRNIKKLALIVADDQALKELRLGNSLDAAYRKTRGLLAEFTEFLVSTERSLAGAASMVALIDLDAEQKKRIENISKQVAALIKFAS